VDELVNVEIMRLIIGLVCIAFVEVAVTILLTKYFGAAPTYFLFAIPTIIGLFIQWRRKPIMEAAWAKVEKGLRSGDIYDQKLRMTRPSYVEPQAELYTYWVTIFLLAIPGPLTAAVAFSLMLPFVKKCIRKKMVGDAKAYRRKLQEWKLDQP
jgi:UPF0716 family protein affecting phage T7 exclusion